jgi:uncharacterized protein (DUF1697 family)
MPTYVAFPRGINAGHRMTMADLRGVFESLGYDDVRTVLASGNVLFETGRTAEATLIGDIEKALTTTFRARIPVVLRSRAELERLARAKPFADVEDGPTTRPYVSFLKTKPRKGRMFPQGDGYRVLGIVERTVCSVVNLSGATSPDLMRVLDKEFGKEVTTRGWPTIEKILRAAGS